MDAQQRMAFMMLVFNAIFNSKANNTDISQVAINHPNIVNSPAKGRWFKGGTLRGFDITMNTGAKVVTLRCLEQNPTLTSQYAIQARNGSRIMWVIQLVTTGADNWLGRMQDGEWHASQERATTAVIQPTPPGPVASAGEVGYTPEPQEFHDYEEPIHMEDLPDIPEMADIPEAVLMSMAEDDDDPNQY